VHGGGWSGGDAREGGGFDDFPALLASLAAQNYVVASIDYRLSGEAHFPAAEQDVKSAIRWLRAHADDYGIDTTRIAIWGEEAGGQLAALAGTSCGVAMLEPPKTGIADDKAPSDCVQAVIDWHGISDLATLAADSGRDGNSPSTSPEAAYLGCEPAACPAGLVRTASPIAYAGPNSPPFLIQHGPHKTVPLVQSQKLFEALNNAHSPVEQATYADSDTDIAEKSVDRLIEFLGKTFPRKTTAKPVPRPKSGSLPY
jgi:acetyl esterase/lipase